MGVNMTMVFYRLKMHLCMECTQMKKLNKFVNMYTSCVVSLLPNPLQNAQQHWHLGTCKKKTICL
jgi:hypothetical protein